jgi:hypothetical protein
MKKKQTDLLQGTLDLLALKTLQPGPAHGWDIAQRILQADRRRPGTVRGRDRDVEAFYRGGGTDFENVLKGRIWPCSTS